MLSIIQKLVNYLVGTDGDIVAGGHFADIDRDGNVKTVNYGVFAGGHIDVVFIDVTYAGRDDIEGDFAVGIDELEAINHAGDRAKDVAFDNDIKDFGIVGGVHHPEEVGRGDIGIGGGISESLGIEKGHLAGGFFVFDLYESIAKIW